MLSMTPHLLKHLDLYLITVDKHLDCHLLHTIFDAFEHLHNQQQLSSNSSRTQQTELRANAEVSRISCIIMTILVDGVPCGWQRNRHMCFVPQLASWYAVSKVFTEWCRHMHMTCDMYTQLILVMPVCRWHTTISCVWMRNNLSRGASAQQPVPFTAGMLADLNVSLLHSVAHDQRHSFGFT